MYIRAENENDKPHFYHIPLSSFSMHCMYCVRDFQQGLEKEERTGKKDKKKKTES